MNIPNLYLTLAMHVIILVFFFAKKDSVGFSSEFFYFFLYLLFFLKIVVMSWYVFFLNFSLIYRDLSFFTFMRFWPRKT